MKSKKKDGKGSLTKVEEAFRSLDVELGAGKIEISYADVEKVEVEQEETPLQMQVNYI